MREPLRIVCEFVGACVLAGMALGVVWAAVALAAAAVRDLVDRRRRHVPQRWVHDELRRRRDQHPSRTQ